MPVIGFHASHEQIPPGGLLAAARHAEEVGVTAAMCSDHVAPRTPQQGESGFAWSWLGAALATCGQMFPGRFWVALGSGENCDEHVTGAPWPRKDAFGAQVLPRPGVRASAGVAP